MLRAFSGALRGGILQGPEVGPADVAQSAESCHLVCCNLREELSRTARQTALMADCANKNWHKNWQTADKQTNVYVYI